MAWVKDRAGRYLWVNRAFAVAYALDQPADTAGILGKTDYDLSPPFLADLFRLDDEQALAGQSIVDRIELVGPSAEQAAWHVTNKIPFRNARGKIIGAAGMTRPLDRPGAFEAASGFGPALARMREAYHKPLSNQTLARLSGMSTRAFERKFRAAFHSTPQKYLRRLRLGVASRLLVFTRQSLADVGLACGFADQSHFTREFRRHFKRTPRAYRERYAPSPGPAAFVTKSAATGQ